MNRNKLISLLKQRPGYEVVHLLLEDSPRRRETLAEHAGTHGGGLQRWLERAEEEGLVSREESTRKNKYGTKIAVEYSLAEPIPSDLKQVIHDRGGRGDRTKTDIFTDKAKIHTWDDDHDIKSSDHIDQSFSA